MLDIFLYAGRAIMPLLLMMALGCGLRRAGRWSDDFYRQLNGFCFHVLLPVQLFLNVYAIEDLSVLNWQLLGFIVLCVLGAAGLGVAVAPLFARDRGQRAVIAQATFRANQVIMGIPLARRRSWWPERRSCASWTSGRRASPSPPWRSCIRR